jgi:hypothetical protein
LLKSSRADEQRPQLLFDQRAHLACGGHIIRAGIPKMLFAVSIES